MAYKFGTKFNEEGIGDGTYVPEYPGCKGCLYAKEDFVYDSRVIQFGYNNGWCKKFTGRTGKPSVLSCEPGKTMPKEKCKYYTHED